MDYFKYKKDKRKKIKNSLTYKDELTIYVLFFKNNYEIKIKYIIDLKQKNLSGASSSS